jgi:hypothetical protein
MTSASEHDGGGAVTSMTEFPLAPRGTVWNGEEAEAAIRTKTGAGDAPSAAYGRCFFWHDADAVERYGSYKLLYCDVIDDEIKAVPHAIFAVAGILDGARGGTSIPESDQVEIKTVVGQWYEKMAEAFDDASLSAPWARTGEGS